MRVTDTKSIQVIEAARTMSRGASIWITGSPCHKNVWIDFREVWSWRKWKFLSQPISGSGYFWLFEISERDLWQAWHTI